MHTNNPRYCRPEVCNCLGVAKSFLTFYLKKAKYSTRIFLHSLYFSQTSYAIIVPPKHLILSFESASEVYDMLLPLVHIEVCNSAPSWSFGFTVSFVSRWNDPSTLHYHSVVVCTRRVLKFCGYETMTDKEFVQARMRLCGCLHKDNWLESFSHCLGTVHQMGVAGNTL